MPRRSGDTKSGPPRPTESEVAILAVLWDRGPSTVRQVYEIMSERQEIGYTTVLKFMQIMTDKGLLAKDTSVRPQVYRAAQPRQTTQRRLVKDLLDRAFSGSPGTLALQALAMRKSTPEELRELRVLLDKLEADR